MKSAEFLQPKRSDSAGSAPPMAQASTKGSTTPPNAYPSSANPIAMPLRRMNQLFTAVIIGSHVPMLLPRAIIKKTMYSCHSAPIWLKRTNPTPSTVKPMSTMRRLPSLSIMAPIKGPSSPPSNCVRE